MQGRWGCAAHGTAAVGLLYVCGVTGTVCSRPFPRKVTCSAYQIMAKLEAMYSSPESEFTVQTGRLACL